MMVETDKCKFFVIACYAKEKDGSLRQKDEFVGYWYCPLIGESLKDLVHAKHYASFEEAETVCNEINDDDRFFYGKIKRYEVRLNEPMCTGSGTDEFQRELDNATLDAMHEAAAKMEDLQFPAFPPKEYEREGL